jgi:hypothetical protein
MLGNLYANVVANQTLFWVLIALVFGGGIVAAMIGGTIRDMLLDWREDREEARHEEAEAHLSSREAKAQQDATRILEGLYPERYHSEISNEVYHTGEQRRTLADKWRALIDETAPRSPEIVAESVYRERTYAFAPVRAEVARSWPQWTDQERATPGRHRAAPEWDLDALNVPTGSFAIIRGRELVSA